MIVQTESGALVTHDLIGIDCRKELDLDGHVPFGFEKHLDLKSGTVYLERRKSSNTCQYFEQNHQIDDQTIPNLQDLNQPLESAISITLSDDTDLELKLDSFSSSSSSSSSSSPYQSACTLDKVKFALETVEKENKKRSISMLDSCASQASNSSSSIRETTVDNHDKDDGSSEAYAVGCPNCLLFVFISRAKPNCPRCNMIVPSPTLSKKPRIDLNFMG